MAKSPFQIDQTQLVIEAIQELRETARHMGRSKELASTLKVIVRRLTIE